MFNFKKKRYFMLHYTTGGPDTWKREYVTVSTSKFLNSMALFDEVSKIINIKTSEFTNLTEIRKRDYTTWNKHQVNL